MPKMKSKGAVKGRFKISKNGKVSCGRPGRGHMHATKNGKQARALRKQIQLPHKWGVSMRKMMGG